MLADPDCNECPQQNADIQSSSPDPFLSLARAFYLDLRANGWDATIARRKGNPVEKKVNVTIGEYLEAVKAKKPDPRQDHRKLLLCASQDCQRHPQRHRQARRLARKSGCNQTRYPHR
jgi:hypothetical protein